LRTDTFHVRLDALFVPRLVAKAIRVHAFIGFLFQTL
jgi:hypothetical protein